MTPILTVSDLWMEYGDTVVLERVNLTVESGAFCSIVGASGCGKSTFLRLLLGQERQTSGVIMLDGKTLRDEPDASRGVVFQRYSVFPHLSVIDNVILGLEFQRAPIAARLFGAARRAARDEAAQYLDAVGLGSAHAKFPAELSGGMQQRLAIAQTLVMKPRIVLLDEPFGALDPGTRAAMHALLLGLWRETGMTIFMVTHDISEGFALGTRLLVFDRSREDPQAPHRFGATITYDIPLSRGVGGDDQPETTDLAKGAPNV